MRTQIELTNDVAAELAGSQDTVLRALEAQLECKVYLRGNLLTFDGEAEETHAGERIVGELSDLIARGHQIDPATITAVTGALDAHESPARVLEDVVWSHRGLRVAPKTVNQKRYVDSIRNKTVTFGVGPAGTGKTFLAVAMAAAALARNDVNRIILTRPAVEAGERLGFLPGDLMAKVDPYLRPLFDALHDMLDPERVSAHLERGVIEIAPLAFMRGRTLNDSFVILDEAQNTTPEQMKMFLTRLGFGSKMVVTGDITQVDLPREQQSGLIVVGDILDQIEDIDFVRFGGDDVVRHRLVQRIVEAYETHTRQETPPRLTAMLDVEVLGRALAPAAPQSAAIRRLCERTANACGVDRGHVAIEFVGAERIRELNAEHRDKDEPTDVLSFPIDGIEGAGDTDGAEGGGADAPSELGDIVICAEHTADIGEAIVHGMLHLLGMDHESDDGEMLALQQDLLAADALHASGSGGLR
jgi:phosphate starvation-inducible PhoH-like protein